MADLQKLKDDLCTLANGMTAAEAYAQGICVCCKEPALPKCHSAAGVREYAISAMCEECWDREFADVDDT